MTHCRNIGSCTTNSAHITEQLGESGKFSELYDGTKPASSKRLTQSRPGDNRAHNSTRTKKYPKYHRRKESHHFPEGPTGYLLAALHHARNHDVYRMNSLKSEQKLYSTSDLEEPAWEQTGYREKYPCKLSFPSIVADYIRYVEPLLSLTCGPGAENESSVLSRLDEALEVAFSDEKVNYLARRGYDVMDVVSWAWVLRGRDIRQSIMRLLILEKHHREKHSCNHRGFPPFIALFLLRNSFLDAATLRLLVIYCLRLINGQTSPIQSERGAVTEELNGDTQGDHDPEAWLDRSTCMILVVRLLRQARRVLPQAQVPLARAYAHHLAGLKNLGQRRAKDDLTLACNRFKTEKFNRILYLLSLPAKQEPYSSVPIQQQAQVEVLRVMASHQPIIPVVRRGYQGVFAVQLAHRKTTTEGQFAALKAPSWPPWKEDRMGIDSERGTEGMKSRSMQVLGRMTAAGYSRGTWEEAASVLAGWDTDSSPTIQTRAFIERGRPLRRRLRPSSPEEEIIWSSRIHATRTVREAWACFLSYRDQGFEPRARIYVAMAEKLIYRKKTRERKFDPTIYSMPGDVREVFPEPASARDVIYVRAEPPTLEEFVEEMVSLRMRPNGKFLGLLLANAPSYDLGLHYLHCSNLTPNQIDALCTVFSSTSEYADQGNQRLESLRGLNLHVFSGFIRFLCKFSSFDAADLCIADMFPIAIGEGRTFRKTSLFEQAGVEGIAYPQTLRHAIQLMRALRPVNSPPWTCLLRHLRNDRITSGMTRSLQRILSWHETLKVFDWTKELGVGYGSDVFQNVCHNFVNAVVAGAARPDCAIRALALLEENTRIRGAQHDRRAYRTFEDMVYDGLGTLKSHFDELVVPDQKVSKLIDSQHGISEDACLPTIHLPSYVALHMFIRALGVCEDRDGLLSLLRWMSQSAAKLNEASYEHYNGTRMMRRCLVGTRVFLEGAWDQGKLSRATVDTTLASPFRNGFTSKSTMFNGTDDGEIPIFSDPVVQEAYEIIESTPEWNGWPTDKEVEDYKKERL